jgi:UDP-3-O-[3-hydroxymyristoyl] N-acetylglucosamine deacetylase
MSHNTLSTVAAAAAFVGVSLHSGAPSSVRVLPAGAGSGIVFRRVDLPGQPEIRAAAACVGPLVLCTTLRGRADVATVEHLMAALSACGVDDAVVEIDGPEVPIMDGSAMAFFAGLRAVGLARSREARPVIKVVRTVEVRDGDKSARIEPCAAFVVDCAIDFAHPAIGRSAVSVDLSVPGAFERGLADARTFTLLTDVEKLRAAGFARGGSLDNAVVVGDGGVLNPGGLRHADEFARHKALDAVGDLALAGAPILGRYVGFKSGHALNNALLRALEADRAAWTLVVDRAPSARLRAA